MQMTVPHNTVDSLFDAKTQFRDSTVFHKIVRNKKIATKKCLLHFHVVKICLKYERFQYTTKKWKVYYMILHCIQHWVSGRMITLITVQGASSTCSSEWKKDVIISHFESPLDVGFCSCENLDDVSMKKCYIFPLLSIKFRKNWRKH